jgi:hypothetical protein
MDSLSRIVNADSDLLVPDGKTISTRLRWLLRVFAGAFVLTSLYFFTIGPVVGILSFLTALVLAGGWYAGSVRFLASEQGD